MSSKVPSTGSALWRMLLIVQLSLLSVAAQNATGATNASATTAAAGLTTLSTATTGGNASSATSTISGTAPITTSAVSNTTATTTRASTGTTTTRAPNTTAAPSIFVIANTVSLNVSKLRDPDSSDADRRLLVTVVGATLNRTWCTSAVDRSFQVLIDRDINTLSQCSFARNIKQLLQALSCSPAPSNTIEVLFNAVPRLALSRDESMNFVITGNYIQAVPQPVIQPLPLVIVADINSTCDPNITTRINTTRAPNTTLPPKKIRPPWPSDVDLFVWNIVFAASALFSFFATAIHGGSYLPWLQRSALLSSRGCDWTNMTQLPMHIHPFVATLEGPWSISPANTNLVDSEDAPMLMLFLSSLMLNVIVAGATTLFHFLLAGIFTITTKRFSEGMARARFPGSIAWSGWLFVLTPTIGCAVTLYVKNITAISIFAAAVGGVAVLVCVGAVVAHLGIVLAAFGSRAVKCDAKTQGTNWLTTPNTMWGDRLEKEGFTNKFGALFRAQTANRRWFVVAEVFLLAIQTSVMSVRTDYPDCLTGAFAPLAVSGILSVFASLILDPFCVFSDRGASYVLSALVVIGGLAAAFLPGNADAPDGGLGEWASRTDLVAVAAMSAVGLYSLFMTVLGIFRFAKGTVFSAPEITEEEEDALLQKLGKPKRGAQGEPKALDIGDDELEMERRMREEEEEKLRHIDPTILAEPDPEVREVLMRGNWLRVETDEGPYYFNRHTGRTTWDLRDELGMPKLSKKCFFVRDLSDDEDDLSPEAQKERELAKRLGIVSKKPFDEVADALAKKVWVAVEDSSGRTYFYNPTTNKTCWDLAKELGVKAAADRSVAAASAKKADRVADALSSGEWVAVTDPSTKGTYFYHPATRRTVWDLKAELGADDDDPAAKRKRMMDMPPPPPPAIVDPRTITRSDMNALAALMVPINDSAQSVPPVLSSEARLWWMAPPEAASRAGPMSLYSPPQAAQSMIAAGAGPPGPQTAALLSSVERQWPRDAPPENPLTGIPREADSGNHDSPPRFADDRSSATVDHAVASFANHPSVAMSTAEAVLRVMQEQSASPRADPVGDAIAHALATRQWLEIVDPQTQAAFYINPVTKQTTTDLRTVFEANAGSSDPVADALAKKEWIKMRDPVTDRDFFVHVQTKRVTWDLQAELFAHSKTVALHPPRTIVSMARGGALQPPSEPANPLQDNPYLAVLNAPIPPGGMSRVLGIPGATAVMGNGVVLPPAPVHASMTSLHSPTYATPTPGGGGGAHATGANAADGRLAPSYATFATTPPPDEIAGLQGQSVMLSPRERGVLPGNRKAHQHHPRKDRSPRSASSSSNSSSDRGGRHRKGGGDAHHRRRRHQRDERNSDGTDDDMRVGGTGQRHDATHNRHRSSRRRNESDAVADVSSIRAEVNALASPSPRRPAYAGTIPPPPGVVLKTQRERELWDCL